MNKAIYNEILQVGCVSTAIKEKYFSGVGFIGIRDKMEEIGLDRHTPIEFEATEIAVLTPLGILMQIRPSDNDQLGVWGGILDDGEEPAEGAIRELFEETGICITKDDLEFVEIDEHFHKYANGDKVYFTSYRYIVRFDYVPTVITDEESTGTVMVAHTILYHQQEFIKRVLDGVKK